MGTGRLPLPGWIVALAAVLTSGLIPAATSSAQYGGYPTYPPYSSNPPPSGSSGSGSTSKKKPAKTVTIKGSMGTYHFKPKKVTIKKGSTVKWSWNSDEPHNVTFGKKRHSTTAMKVKSFKLTFKKKGTFNYTCTVHGFAGTVVVN